MKNLVLIVNNEANVLAEFKRVFLGEPYEIVAAECAEKALDFLAGESFKVVISDERMPEIEGAEFLALVKERHPETALILLTGYSSLEATMKAVNDGEIFRFFSKPWDEYQMKMAVRSAIEKYDLEAENRRLLLNVNRQATELSALEEKYPGITRAGKNGGGTSVIPEIPEDELDLIIRECTRKCG